LVDGPDLKFTAPDVLSVAITVSDDVEAGAAGDDAGVEDAAVEPPLPPRVKKSDLMKPVDPFDLTLDHPAGLCSKTSTLVPATTVSKTLDVIEADALKLTPSVVRNVAELFIGNFKKSDLIKPVDPPA